MLDGFPLVDVHLHAANRPTLKLPWATWVQGFADDIGRLYDDSGLVIPAAFDAMLAAEGVDTALLMSEYSPKVTGTQAIEDNLAIAAADPGRIKVIGSVNPHLHYPVDEEVRRQLALGAVALKIHPVHGGFEARDRMLYPAYAWAEQHGLPVIVHCGTSVFSGSVNSYADPILLDEVFRDFPGLTVVLAHGGRGWWYEQAAFVALTRPNVWLEVSGLPPQRLPDYYGRSLRRLADKMIFGTDWPGVPGVERNARGVEKALAGAGCTAEQVTAVLGGNAARVFGLR
jgi:uncharacterized protein